MCQKAAKRPLG